MLTSLLGNTSLGRPTRRKRDRLAINSAQRKALSLPQLRRHPPRGAVRTNPRPLTRQQRANCPTRRDQDRPPPIHQSPASSKTRLRVPGLHNPLLQPSDPENPRSYTDIPAVDVDLTRVSQSSAVAVAMIRCLLGFDSTALRRAGHGRVGARRCCFAVLGLWPGFGASVSAGFDSQPNTAHLAAAAAPQMLPACREVGPNGAFSGGMSWATHHPGEALGHAPRRHTPASHPRQLSGPMSEVLVGGTRLGHATASGPFPQLSCASPFPGFQWCFVGCESSVAKRRFSRLAAQLSGVL